jgi:hypothetical protein
VAGNGRVRRGRLLAAIAAVAGVVLIGLFALIAAVGLDRADKIASVVGALVAVIGLAASSFVAVQSRRDGAEPVHSYTGDVIRPGVAPRRSLSGGAVAALVVAALMAGVCVVGSVSMLINLLPDRTTPESAGSRTATAAPGDDGADEPAPAIVIWSGEIRLDETPRDFDYEPPSRGNYSIDMQSDAYLNGSSYHKYWGGPVVTWTKTADPKRDDCATRLTTHGVEQVPLSSRSRICLATNGGRIVFLKILGRNGSGYDAKVTIWAPA